MESAKECLMACSKEEKTEAPSDLLTACVMVETMDGTMVATMDLTMVGSMVWTMDMTKEPLSESPMACSMDMAME